MNPYHKARVTWATAVAWACLFGAERLEAQPFKLAGAGVRAGFAASQRSDWFNQFEATTTFGLPWQCTWAGFCHMEAELDLAAGVLRGRGAESLIATAGPVLLVGPPETPGRLRMGVCPTYLGRPRLGERDFGFPLQFTSFAGFEVEMGGRFEFGYRFQHMSNGGWGSRNPGLNLHAISITYRF